MKAKEKNLAKDPNYYVNLGRKGGKVSRGGGFQYSKKHGLDWHIEAGRRGGQNGKRGPKVVH